VWVKAFKAILVLRSFKYKYILHELSLVRIIPFPLYIVHQLHDNAYHDTSFHIVLVFWLALRLAHHVNGKHVNNKEDTHDRRTEELEKQVGTRGIGNMGSACFGLTYWIFIKNRHIWEFLAMTD
jgi:hypothetical protein